jgi:hypothetical protein
LTERLDLLHYRAARLRINIASGDPNAGLGQGQRYRTSYSRRAADDDREFSGKTRLRFQ